MQNFKYMVDGKRVAAKVAYELYMTYASKVVSSYLAHINWEPEKDEMIDFISEVTNGRVMITKINRRNGGN